MGELLLGLAVLACPVGMGLMMWLMMRGGHAQPSGQQPPSQRPTGAEIARLRAEIDQLRAAQRDTPHPTSPEDSPVEPR